MTAIEWLELTHEGQTNLTSFCLALVWNGGVAPKDDIDGRNLTAIMQRMRAEIDTVPEGIGEKCLAVINNQLANYNTSLAALLAKDLG